jgi:hypothetical protein
MTIYGMGKILFKLTSACERFLSGVKPLRTFSGYCYMAGTKNGGECRTGGNGIPLPGATTG